MKILNSIAVGLVFFCFLVSANVGAVDVERTYSFGITPHKNARLMLHVWKPILRYLSKKTGVKLKLETGITEQLFKKVLYKGVYDFAYVNPYMLLKASDVQHYDAFARIQNKKVRAIIVTANTSTLQTINDLDIDVEMGFSKRAYSANFLSRALLLQHKKKVEPNFTLDASSGYFGVSNGILVVAGGDMKTFNDTDSVVKKNLRILWASPAYTPNAFAVHPRVE